MNIIHVCVIGAGISGLVAAKTFLEEGYDVTLFEKQKGVGGVWEKSRTYPGVTTQTVRDAYAFSDYPMPASYPEWPTGEQVRNYLQSYAQHFGILEKIQFGMEVTNVERKTGGHSKWIVTTKTQGETTKQKHEFDFVLICNGTANISNIPNLPGKEEFTASGGKILHSSEFNDSSLIKGKRVVVLGFGKSACDIATFAAANASECTLVFRKADWKIPMFFLGLINFKYVLLTRFAETFFPKRQLQGMERWLHIVRKPLISAFWWTNEMLLRRQFRLESCGMLPKESLVKSVTCSLGVAPQGFYKHVLSGKIRSQQTSIAKFVPGGLCLANGEQLQADMVIFGTGFRQHIPFLEEKYRRLVMDEQGNFHLYRNLIHPEIPNLGFVGYNSSFFCPLTSEIGSWWLAESINGNLATPSPEEMYKAIKVEKLWRYERSYVSYGGTCVIPYSFYYIEQLLNDMGVSNQCQGWKKIQEMMMPLNISAYKYVRQQLRDRKFSTGKSRRNSELLLRSIV
ncbi:MAG: FAD-dependent oxidoreductase [Rhizonema sp. NSF051]|nr:FAD-dependent oxidoreductase [Rhizonema sp. NSF051]